MIGNISQVSGLDHGPVLLLKSSSIELSYLRNQMLRKAPSTGQNMEVVVLYTEHLSTCIFYTVAYMYMLQIQRFTKMMLYFMTVGFFS